MTQSASVGGNTVADFETAGSGRTTAPTPYALGDAPGILALAAASPQGGS